MDQECKKVTKLNEPRLESSAVDLKRQNDHNTNRYLKDLQKLEFIVTYACTGHCLHCSEGDHASCGERIDPQIAADAVRRLAAEFDIKTVLAFGGEPLLYTDAVYAIMKVAKELNIPKRQVITNGYFSKDAERIREVAEHLAACGVNELLLSVDAFHQETIPLDTVKRFAAEAKNCGIPIRLHPAWLVSTTDDNPYNRKTSEILDSFADMELSAGEGNVIFPEGNALKHLSGYIKVEPPENPYAEDPCDVRCVSFEPNGDVLGGNVYERDIMEIVKAYAPKLMRRIIVIGCPGSGKSTFARALHKKTGIPLYHLDMMYWNADKTTVEKSVFLERLSAVLEKDEWIIDGNYGSTMELRMAACDTVIFLDPPLETCLDGIRERRGKPRSDMPWIETEEDAEFIEFIKGYNERQKPKVLGLLDKYSDKRIIILKSREEADAFVNAKKPQ